MTTAYITDSRFNAHTLAGHVEFAGRLNALYDVMNQQSLPRRMKELIPLEATDAQLRAVHTQEYLDLLAWSERQHGIHVCPDTYVLPQSCAVAQLPAGA